MTDEVWRKSNNPPVDHGQGAQSREGSCSIHVSNMTSRTPPTLLAVNVEKTIVKAVTKTEIKAAIKTEDKTEIKSSGVLKTEVIVEGANQTICKQGLFDKSISIKTALKRPENTRLLNVGGIDYEQLNSEITVNADSNDDLDSRISQPCKFERLSEEGPRQLGRLGGRAHGRFEESGTRECHGGYEGQARFQGRRQVGGVILLQQYEPVLSATRGMELAWAIELLRGRSRACHKSFPC